MMDSPEEIEERRRYTWFLRYGAEWTLSAIGKEVDRTRETVRKDVLNIERKIYHARRRPPSHVPCWWQRLHDAGALRRDNPNWFWVSLVDIPPQEKS